MHTCAAKSSISYMIYTRFEFAFCCVFEGLMIYSHQKSKARHDLTTVCIFFGVTQIAKTIGSTSIRHRSHTFVSDRYLIDVDPSVFAIWEYIIRHDNMTKYSTIAYNNTVTRLGHGADF